MSSGFPRARETCRKIGIEFDSWQTDLNRCILAKSADGLLAADTVALSIARQVGKTFDVGALQFAQCIIEPNTTVIWTAHRFKVARETFNELRGLAKSPKLTPHLNFDDITTAAGNESIPFRNGSRIVFAARERGAIRGFTKVRRLILDEAQILTHAALSDLAPTMNQAADPQIILMGTPPKPTDPSEVWTEFRRDALEGKGEGLLFVELSAKPDADLDDRDAWRDANPSFPSRTPARSILRLRKLLSDDDFRREALGIWDDDAAGTAAIPFGTWQRQSDPGSGITGPVALALEVSQDRNWACIGSAGARSDGSTHAQVAENHRDTDWVLDKAAPLGEVHGKRITIAPNTPAGRFIEDFEAAGWAVQRVTPGEYAQACGLFFDLASQGAVWHVGQPELDAAVRGARWRQSADTRMFDRRRAGIDISPLAAVVLAVWAHRTATPRNAGRGRVIALT